MQKFDLAVALEKASKELEASSTYQWGHMGSCNCGFLARQITGHSAEQIHSYSMQRSGDWADQLRDYCPTSNLPMDEVIYRMEKTGVSLADLGKLERLSEERILQRIPSHRKPLKYNSSSDAALYMKVWSEMIKEELLQEVELPLEILNELTKKNYALVSQ
jgi:hypothetical protein